ncbi:hypothetical protein S83_002402 [Arachis hypogaea]
MPLMAVDTSRLLVRTSRTMPRMTPPPPRIPNRRSSLSTAANSPRPSPYSSFSPLAFSASTSPPPNLAASSSHALSPIFSSSISDPKKKRGLLGFIDSISINAIFSSSSSVVSLYHHPVKFRREKTRTRATLDDTEIGQLSSTPLLVEDDKPSKEVEESVKVLKDAAKTRKVAAEKVLSALSIIEKAKIDPSGFLETLGGNESPGRT